MREDVSIREIDSMGRIVIPVELRRALKLGPKSLVEVYVENDHISIYRHSPACIFCGSEENVTRFSDKTVCKKCISKMKNL